MSIPAWAWVLIVGGLALFLFHHARAGIAGSINPHAMAEFVFVGLLIMLAFAVAHYEQHPTPAGGSTPLESIDLCTPPKTPWPRAPQPTANLAGCPGYNAPEIDPAHDIPLSPSERGAIQPDGSMPLPTWAAHPGGTP